MLRSFARGYKRIQQVFDLRVETGFIRQVLSPLPFTKDLVDRQKERIDLTMTDRLIDVVGVRQGMVILDVGTGSGQYAYKFAEALKGTGAVFATDVLPESVEYLQREADRRGLKNIYPVVVGKKGVDAFYAQHAYDLVFFAHSIQQISDLRSYFQQISCLLRPGGRVVILRSKMAVPFRKEDVTDIPGFCHVLAQEASEGPFGVYFQNILPHPHQDLQKGVLHEDTVTQIVFCLNKVLFDKNFYKNFLNENQQMFRSDLRLSPIERRWLNWGLGYLRERDSHEKKSVSPEQEYRWLINQTLILQKFRPFLYKGKSPFFPGGKIALRARRLGEILKNLGYRLEGEYDFIPYEFLEVYAHHASGRNTSLSRALWRRMKYYFKAVFSNK